MYQDTITLFNKKFGSELTGDTWYPTVIKGVNLNIDRAAILAKYGPEAKDTAMMFIRVESNNGKTVIDCGNGIKKPWMSPKSWDGTASALTFNPNGDFFWKGEWKNGIVSDSQYKADGFFGYMNQTHDFVYKVSDVAMYSVIPHFEIMGR